MWLPAELPTTWPGSAQQLCCCRYTHLRTHALFYQWVIACIKTSRLELGRHNVAIQHCSLANLAQSYQFCEFYTNTTGMQHALRWLNIKYQHSVIFILWFIESFRALLSENFKLSQPNIPHKEVYLTPRELNPYWTGRSRSRHNKPKGSDLNFVSVCMLPPLHMYNVPNNGDSKWGTMAVN